MTSAYPIPADVLEDRVRALAASLGEWPSQRRVMRECRVGAPRADAALAAVRASGFDPTKPARPLTVVPNRPTAPDTQRAAGPAAGSEPTVDDTGPPEAAPTDAPDRSDESVTGAATQRAESTVDGQVSPVAETPAGTLMGALGRAGRLPRWPLLLIAAGAFVAIWGGWVGLGELTGFGPIRLLPGIADGFVINSAITLPLGMEAYAAFALRAWLAPATAGLSPVARRFACWSALGALGLGAAGQIAYHLMVAAGIARAPWPITAFVSCLPVIVLGCGAALAHLTHRDTAPGEA